MQNLQENQSQAHDSASLRGQCSTVDEECPRTLFSEFQTQLPQEPSRLFEEALEDTIDMCGFGVTVFYGQVSARRPSTTGWALSFRPQCRQMFGSHCNVICSSLPRQSLVSTRSWASGQGFQPALRTGRGADAVSVRVCVCVCV